MIFRAVLLSAIVLGFGCNDKSKENDIYSSVVFKPNPELVCKRMLQNLESSIASTLTKTRDRGNNDLTIELVTTKCSENILFARVRMTEMVKGKREGNIFVYKLSIFSNGELNVEVVGIETLSD